MNISKVTDTMRKVLPLKYCGAIIEKYKDDMPLWAFVEVITFGTLIDLVRFCSERWEDGHLEDVHYLLKDVKGIRNAAAHGSCILNGKRESAQQQPKLPNLLNKALPALNLSKAARKTISRNARMRQIAATCFAYSEFVLEGSAKRRRDSSLSEAVESMLTIEALLPTNNPAVSMTALTRKLISGFSLV